MLTISPEAKRYIMEKGGAVTVRLVAGGGCCATVSPVTITGRPHNQDKDNYRLIEADGVQLYVHDSMRVLPGGISITLNKLLWFKMLQVTGLDI